MITVVSIWLFGFVFSVPGLLSIKLDESVDGSHACGSNWNEHESNIFLLIKFIFIYIIPILIILFSSTKLLIFLRDSKKLVYLGQKFKASHQESKNPNHSQNKVKLFRNKKNNVQKRAVKMVLSIVVLFITQWTPIWMFEMFSSKHTHYLQIINVMTTVLSHSISISNPLIYIILSHKFLIFDYLRKCFKCNTQRPVIV